MNRKLLILDDEPGLLDSYRIILSPAASPSPQIVSSRRSATLAMKPAPLAELFEVSYVTTGEEALTRIEKAKEEGAPFIGGFFDVKLGAGIDGIETIRRAKDIDPDLYCVMVTAYQDRSLDEITKIFGAEFADRWDFLTKPFSHNEILQKSRNLVMHWERKRKEKEYLEKIKSQQQALIESERLAAIGTLARGIGHEFGNILMRIIGMAEVAVLKNDHQESLQTLKNIASAAERAGVIVRNLQSMVKIQPTRESLDIHTALQDAATLISHELKKFQVELVKDFGEKIPNLHGSRVELGQVFLNLMINAVHAMEKSGGKLTLTTKLDSKAKGVFIEVTDTGHGIPPELMPRIFEPLFTTKGEKGSGLGLSVSQKIITNHQGRIDVTSQPGKGTTFQIWLPA